MHKFKGANFFLLYSSSSSYIGRPEVQSSLFANNLQYTFIYSCSYKQLPIFELNPTDKSLKAFGQLKVESEFSDVVWAKDSVYLFSPEVPSMKRYHINENGIISDNSFHHPRLLDARTDIKGILSFSLVFILEINMHV